ncbi:MULTISPECIES: preprotein translocase subunit SecE [Streptococcus]|uniref:Preprotein translocase subunit SecE n=2 Tax=Streptococcus cristatus TaxID=45634 RepID=A0A0F2CJI7_STRCR|nr:MULTISPECIES: preprotein translocase subunit SecE [Streptococcus]RKV80324.1 MAG: preprotein translocase subunit SecE [Streptococcus sp.]EGU68422.1 preprotein translocase, SecE subunit [Streptococcus cristatus ATCC 51100]KJQ57820.1 preprotein translocase subunit SecE [Streptococcus cristatus]KJQ60549.1 preprotein translocase subunit SecE [Streptococcus cristatus]MBC6976544.1 preprotein translocase subunit SecE [Streptococcus cristatus]
MKFIKDVFVLLRDTTWPTRKERWTDFLSVMEYTAFFAVVIYIFDKVVASGLFRIINMFS